MTTQDDSPSRSQEYLPPPVHPALHRRPGTYRPVPTPPLPPRPTQVSNPPSQTLRSENLPSASNASPIPGAIGDEDDSDAEHEYTEDHLRELYDEEEIDRFIRLFSTYVSEVRSPTHTPSPAGSTPVIPETDPSQDPLDAVLDEVQSGEEDETEWVDPRQTTDVPSVASDQSLAERVAFYLTPYLLPPPNPPRFTVHRLRLVINRLYLAIAPTYLPIFARLAKLATWEDHGLSAFYCAMYWILWYFNLLLPGLVARLLYSLFRRKFLPYPNLEELREHRLEVERAEDFSKTVVTRLVAARSVGILELFKAVKDLQKIRKKQAAAIFKGKGKTEVTDSPDEVHVPEIVVEDPRGDQQDVILKDISPEEVNAVQSALAAANNIADIHERIKNIFLWRSPAASALYGAIFALVFLVTLLPAQYLAKLAGFIAGVAFWHVVPVLAVLPGGASRLPPPLANVPTDAEYAMQLMSQRVAAGLDVIPKKARHKSNWNASQTSLASSGSSTFSDTSHKWLSPRMPDRVVDWQKWGGRVAATKTWTSGVKGMFSDGQWKNPSNWTSGSTSPNREPALHTFPAHYHSPGLITLTDTTLLFTPLKSSRPSLLIELKDIVGVKRSHGFTNGLRVRWVNSNSQTTANEEQEVKLHWVGGQEELFARLVGWNGRRWLTL